MATENASLTLDENVLADARARVGRRGLSACVNEALRRRLQGDRIDAFLAEAEAEVGPIPDEVMEQVRREWDDLSHARATRAKSA